MPRTKNRLALPDRVSLGISMSSEVHTEAARLAAESELSVTQIIRMAITKGLPLVAARLKGESE